MKQHRYIVLACEVFARECYYCAAMSRNIVDVKLLKQGLHDIGEVKMSAALQQELNKVDKEKYEAILLMYGLCNNGIRNLQADIPLVVPRAHDCITLLMGSKDDYLEYFNANPGCFFRSVGWAERAQYNLTNPESTTKQMGMGTYEEYVDKYGEDNAKYLMETLGDHLKNYSRLSYIDTELPGLLVDQEHRQEAQAFAQEKSWEFLQVQGGHRLVKNLMDGNWDEADFLVVPPGQTIEASYDESIIRQATKKQD